MLLSLRSLQSSVCRRLSESATPLHRVLSAFVGTLVVDTKPIHCSGGSVHKHMAWQFIIFIRIPSGRFRHKSQESLDAFHATNNKSRYLSLFSLASIMYNTPSNSQHRMDFECESPAKLHSTGGPAQRAKTVAKAEPDLSRGGREGGLAMRPALLPHSLTRMVTTALLRKTEARV